jgi:hypothetical protein
MFSKVIRLAVTSFALFQIGCATVGTGATHNDGEMELAQRQAEDETLARLASGRVPLDVEFGDGASPRCSVGVV